MKYQHQSLIFTKKLVALVCVGLFIATPVFAATEAEIQAQIEAKKQEMQRHQEEAAALQAKINAALTQVNSLQSQVSLIDQQIAETGFQVQSKQAEIDALSLEMSGIQRTIDTKTAQITDQRQSLAAAIKQLDENSRTSTLSLVLENGTFAEFFSQAQAISTLSASLRDGISTISSARAELQAKQDQLTQTKDQYQQSLLQLKVQQQSVTEQRDFKASLLDQAEGSKSSYEDQADAAQKAEEQANATINALEAQLRESMDGDTPAFTSTGYIWPLKALKGISTYFHDPSYPFNYIYCSPGVKPPACGHPALDIPAPQGTAVKATADGIVSVVHDQGFIRNTAGQIIRSALNYVAIIHDDGVSSRYLHLTKVYVRPDQFVRQGDIIGLSGGLPGTAGSGDITTGAHLHFEIRVNGIPDDPLRYLP